MAQESLVLGSQGFVLSFRGGFGQALVVPEQGPPFGRVEPLGGFGNLDRPVVHDHASAHGGAFESPGE